jgi:hypothetical protein
MIRTTLVRQEMVSVKDCIDLEIKNSRDVIMQIPNA